MMTEFISTFVDGLHAIINGIPVDATATAKTTATMMQLQPYGYYWKSKNFWMSFLIITAGICAPLYYTIVREFVTFIYPLNYKNVRVKKYRRGEVLEKQEDEDCYDDYGIE